MKLRPKPKPLSYKNKAFPLRSISHRGCQRSPRLRLVLRHGLTGINLIVEDHQEEQNPILAPCTV